MGSDSVTVVVMVPMWCACACVVWCEEIFTCAGPETQVKMDELARALLRALFLVQHTPKRKPLMPMSYSGRRRLVNDEDSLGVDLAPERGGHGPERKPCAVGA